MGKKDIASGVSAAVVVACVTAVLAVLFFGIKWDTGVAESVEYIRYTHPDVIGSDALLRETVEEAGELVAEYGVRGAQDIILDDYIEGEKTLKQSDLLFYGLDSWVWVYGSETQKIAFNAGFE